MNRRHAIALLAATPLAAWSQTNETLSLDDLIDMGQQFIEDNIDEEVVAQLADVDEEQVRSLLQRLHTALNQEQLLDLATLKDAATAGLKLLEADPSTEPFAEWLRPRLDYFEVAVELDRKTPTPAPATPKQPAPRKPAPTPKLERTTWAETVKARPRPKAAASYEASLKPIFILNDLPAELFWLAEIESGFNPKARSPAGAVGLYQLMPGTAKALGLSTWPIDERKNPEKCATAAARHLRDLYRQFKDWPLTIAAYNAGAGRVKSKMDSRRRTFDAIAARLPSETQMYVPKLDAVLQLREGIKLEKLPKLT